MLQVTMESATAANLWGNCAGSFVDWQPLPNALYAVCLSLSLPLSQNALHSSSIMGNGQKSGVHYSENP